MIIFANEIRNCSVMLTESSLRFTKADLQKLNKTWLSEISRAAQQGRELWDEPTIRLEDFDINEGNLVLKVSEFNYSVKHALKLSPAIASKYPTMQLKGLMVQCFIKTNDDYFVFGIKSNKYATDLNYCFIGGAYSFQNGKLSTPAEVAKQEIKEEIGVSSLDVDDAMVIGAYLNTNGNIGIVAYVKNKLSKKQVIKIFNSSPTDGEIENLIFVSQNDLRAFVSENLAISLDAVEILAKTVCADVLLP